MSEEHHHHDMITTMGSVLSPMDLRVRALESILVEKGYVDPAAIDALVEMYEIHVGPRNGRAGGGAGLGRSRFPRLAETRTRRRRSQRWVSRAARASIWFAVGKHVRRGTIFVVCHPVFLLSLARARPAAELGTNPRPTARAR